MPLSAMTPLLGRNETYRYLLTICGIGPKTASELVISIDIDASPSVSSVSAGKQAAEESLTFSCNYLARTDGR